MKTVENVVVKKWAWVVLALLYLADRGADLRLRVTVKTARLSLFAMRV